MSNSPNGISLETTCPMGCGRSNLYDMELSLICDQRYDESDMEKIVSVLLKTLLVKGLERI